MLLAVEAKGQWGKLDDKVYIDTTSFRKTIDADTVYVEYNLLYTKKALKASKPNVATLSVNAVSSLYPHRVNLDELRKSAAWLPNAEYYMARLEYIDRWLERQKKAEAKTKRGERDKRQ